LFVDEEHGVLPEFCQEFNMCARRNKPSVTLKVNLY